MDIPALLHTYVHTAIVLASLVEGETTVVLAGYAAHQGHAPWWALTLLAATINFAWDQILCARPAPSRLAWHGSPGPTS